jgi:hypothetical protein
MHTTSHILMIRPVNFAFNDQTAVNNAFQVAGKEKDIQEKALEEFDAFVVKLRAKGIDVIVINDTPAPHTPDSIFPNNWISFHDSGTVVLYPMYAENRRLERKPEVVEEIKKKFLVKHTIDYSKFEKQEKYLEGTGSIVLDRDKNIAYACLSPRTDKGLFEQYCREMSFHPVLFTAVDEKGGQIYHTNVMMCVGDKYVVICLDSIPDQSERDNVINTINNSGKELIEITLDQMNHFAGNMLQVNNTEGQNFLVMSTQAFESLNPQQVGKLDSYNGIIHSSLNTIERNGGGSARCMMAEVHLPLLTIIQ